MSRLISFCSRDSKATVFKANDDGLIAVNLLTDELYSNCKKTIMVEKKKDQYFIDNKFSAILWESKWKNQNDFEVFRSLCMMDIDKEKEQEAYKIEGAFSQAKWDEIWMHKYWFKIWLEMKKAAKKK